MKRIKNVYALYFSPTGGTKKIVETLAKTIGDQLEVGCVVVDITLPDARWKTRIFGKGDLVVFGLPVIAGRVPNLLLPYVEECIIGGGAIGVPVVSFGNRNFDDALVELRNLMESARFQTIAGGAFVSEHSFSKILGAGRPDTKDLAEIRAFGVDIVEKIQNNWQYEMPVFVEGNNPPNPYYTPRDRYGNHIDIRKVKPKTTDACTDCGACVSVCPLGSIDQENPSIINGVCMKCCACVKHCPEGGKCFDDTGFIYHKEELEELYIVRRSCVYFL